jgi:hypothetical protein
MAEPSWSRECIGGAPIRIGRPGNRVACRRRDPDEDLVEDDVVEDLDPRR